MEFEELYGRYQPLVYGIGRRGGVRVGDLEDYMHEVFVEVVKSWSTFEVSENNLDSWQVGCLRRAALFKLTNWHGHKQGRKTATAELRENTAPVGLYREVGYEAQSDGADLLLRMADPSAEDQWLASQEKDEQAELLWAAVNRLPDKHRECMILRYYNEMSYADISEKTGLSDAEAKSAVSYGSSKVKKWLNPDGPAVRARGKMAEKTHCKRGHAFDEENTRLYRTKDGYITRTCRACATMHAQNRRKK